jgi:hypothetical protein
LPRLARANKIAGTDKELMMKSLSLLSALLLACATPAWSAQRNPSAEDYASGLQSFVGRDLGYGVRSTAVTAEGDILVIAVDGPAGWRGRNGGVRLLEADFFIGFCEGDRPDDSVFDGRFGVRIDTTEEGRDLIRGRVVTACAQVARVS